VARADIAITTVPLGAYPTLPVVADSLDVALQAAVPANDEQFVITGHEILIAFNTSTDTAYTVTITSVPVRGRSGDVTAYSLGFGEMMAISPAKSGFVQSNGKCYVEASDASIKFGVIKVAA
jgi:hypothetical protein